MKKERRLVCDPFLKAIFLFVIFSHLGDECRLRLQLRTRADNRRGPGILVCWPEAYTVRDMLCLVYVRMNIVSFFVSEREQCGVWVQTRRCEATVCDAHLVVD
jgi:hypothetical protein